MRRAMLSKYQLPENNRLNEQQTVSGLFKRLPRYCQPLKQHLGTILHHLRPSWGRLMANGRHFGSSLAPLGAAWGHTVQGTWPGPGKQKCGKTIIITIATAIPGVSYVGPRNKDPPKNWAPRDPAGGHPRWSWRLFGGILGLQSPMVRAPSKQSARTAGLCGLKMPPKGLQDLECPPAGSKMASSCFARGTYRGKTPNVER